MNFEKDLETSSNSLSDGQGRQFEKNRRKNDYEDDFIADILEEGKLGDLQGSHSLITVSISVVVASRALKRTSDACQAGQVAIFLTTDHQELSMIFRY